MASLGREGYLLVGFMNGYPELVLVRHFCFSELLWDIPCIGMSMCFYCDNIGELSGLQELLGLYIEETHWIHRIYRCKFCKKNSQRDFVVLLAVEMPRLQSGCNQGFLGEEKPFRLTQMLRRLTSEGSI